MDEFAIFGECCTFVILVFGLAVSLLSKMTISIKNKYSLYSRRLSIGRVSRRATHGFLSHEQIQVEVSKALSEFEKDY